MVGDHAVASLFGFFLTYPLVLWLEGGFIDYTPPFIFIGVLLANFIYFTYFEGRDGQTPVKRFLGLKVVKKNNREIGYRESIVRNVLRGLDASSVYLTGIGFIVASRNNQRLGDIAAGTTVIASNSRDEKHFVSNEKVPMQTRILGLVLAVAGLVPTAGIILKFIGFL